MAYLKDISLQPTLSPIEGETIRTIGWGDPTKTGSQRNAHNTYSHIHLIMQSGRIFVISQCMGEPCIRVVSEDERNRL